MPGLSDDAKKILAIVAAIPRGQVLGYGEVAVRAGLPGRARLVAWALRRAAEDSALPWHRVLRSNRSIAFPKDSPAYREQAALLAAEGWQLVHGRVSWTGQRRQDAQGIDLDRALWGPRD